MSAETYNQVFTMHGTTMVFLVVMPIGAAFANYLMPLQIGARDVAFPRINAFSFWCFLAGGLFLNSSWLFGGGADGGWFNYAPNSGVDLLAGPRHRLLEPRPDHHRRRLADRCGQPDRDRAQHALSRAWTMFKMPVFTWMTLVTQFLLLFAIPVLTCAQFLLMFDRLFHANFFNVQSGGNPLLWENLFWVFGHPEVYLMILPAFGLVSEILPVFARKPIFGYKLHRLLGHRHRLHGLGRVGPPHVRVGHRPDLGHDLLADHDVHRRADRREDPELDRHHVGRQAPVHDARCSTPSA